MATCGQWLLHQPTQFIREQPGLTLVIYTPHRIVILLYEPITPQTVSPLKPETIFTTIISLAFRVYMFVKLIWLEGKCANLILLEIFTLVVLLPPQGIQKKMGLESASLEEMPLAPSPANINISHYYSQSFSGFHCYLTQNPCEMGRMCVFSSTSR